MVQDEIIFRGHPNVRSLHLKTLEITKEENLTLRGDCIIGVGASKACADLDQVLKNRLQQENSIVRLEIIVDSNAYSISGFGSKELTFANSHDIVARKSRFVCPRTICVGCDNASSDIPRKIVSQLQDPQAKGILRVTAE